MILLSSIVEARCGRSYYHNLTYTGNWSVGCWTANCHTDSNSHNVSAEALKLQALSMIKDQLAWKAQALQHQQTQAEIKELFQIFGLQGSLGHLNYGGGSTQFSYGYGYSNTQGSQYSKNFGTVDLMTLYKEAGRLAELQQMAAGQGNEEFRALLKQAVDGQTSYLEQLARGQAAAQALQAAKGHPPQQLNIEKSISIGGTQANTKITSSDGMSQLAGLIQLRCVKCHSGAKLEGGVDMTKFTEFTKPQWDVVTAVLDTPDINKKMPKGGPYLSFEERTLFMNFKPTKE